jgi:arylsulfatase A-like enzyme
MRNMIRHLTILVSASLPGEAPAASRPNVVIILTDDQGWGDLSVNGNSNLATPNIDSLARDGATFDNFYVCQVCAPTRAEFLTGPERSGDGALDGIRQERWQAQRDTASKERLAKR